MLFAVSLACLLISMNRNSPRQELLSFARPSFQMLTSKASWKPFRPLNSYYPEQMYLFAGQEANIFGKRHGIGRIISTLTRPNPQSQVRTFTSLRVEQVRSVCWDDATHVIIFPSFSEFPDIHHASRTDLKDFVSRGNNLVFLGGFSNLAILNEIFGFQLLSVPYQGGPFYKSQRNSHNTPFEAAPRELSEVDGIYGARVKSLPPEARSYYDSLGVSVAFAVRHDLGMVTYLASDFTNSDRTWQRALTAAVAL